MTLASKANGGAETANTRTDDGNLQGMWVVMHQRVLGRAGRGVMVSIERRHGSNIPVVSSCCGGEFLCCQVLVLSSTRPIEVKQHEGEERDEAGNKKRE